MPSTAGVSSMIQAVRTTDGSQPLHRRLAQDEGAAFLEGVPVMVDATGYLDEWDGTSYTGKLCGFAKESATTLTADGVPTTLTYGKVPNQPSAVKIPRGAPLNDGRIGVDIALDSVIFHGQFGTATAAQADVGISYGLTKDTDNHWYVDKAKTLTSGGSSTSQAVVTVVGLDQFDPTRGVYFVVMNVAQQGIR